MEKWSDIWASVVIVFCTSEFRSPSSVEVQGTEHGLSFIQNHSSL